MPSWNDGEFYDASFSVEKSRRYHAKMSGFYDWCHHLARVATALSGTASFFVLLANGLGIGKWLTAVVAVAISIDSVFRFERKARIHDRLYRRFTDLSAKIAVWNATAANLKKAKARRIEIETEEPPVRRLIDLQARNEECRARGVSDEDLVPLSTLQRKLGYVITFGMKSLESWQAQRGRARRRRSRRN